MDVTLLAPGSPDPRHERDVRLLAGRLKVAGVDCRATFLEHNCPVPSLVAGHLATKSVPSSVVAPLVLAASFRLRSDVTGAVNAMRRRAPQLSVTAAEPLGIHSLLLQSAIELLDGQSLAADDGIILATAGLRDARAQAALDRLLREHGTMLTRALGVRAVRAAHVDGGWPLGRVRTLLRRLDGCSSAVVVPLLISDGVVRDRLAKAAHRADLELVPGSLADTTALADLVMLRARAAVWADQPV
ncbi:MAG: sirohydrochlorin chelatase [Candidatus Nanopelagicales bacterium]